MGGTGGDARLLHCKDESIAVFGRARTANDHRLTANGNRLNPSHPAGI